MYRTRETLLKTYLINEVLQAHLPYRMIIVQCAAIKLYFISIEVTLPSIKYRLHFSEYSPRTQVHAWGGVKIRKICPK